MIFAPLPTAFPKLQALVQSMDVVMVMKPPPIEAIGRRLRVAYARASADHYRGLSSGDVRKLPYAYWLPPEQPLHEIHASLVQRYWVSALPEAIQSGPRCRVPCDYVPRRSWPLFKARAVLAGLLASLSLENKP